MVFPKMRALVSGALFVLWLGFLAYLAFANRGRIIVARPQVARSNLVVRAALTDDRGRPAARIEIQDVLFAEKPEWRQLAGKSIDLKELAFFSAKQGWEGPGDYVVPITRRGDDDPPVDQVTLLPMSPGYYPSTSEVTVEVGKGGRNLAANVAELVDAPAERLRELFETSYVKLWHVPLRTDAELAMLAQAIRKSGAEVKEARFAESRLYRATPAVLEQVDQIVTIRK